MYTSGTTGKPKGRQHSTGGYLAYVAGTSNYIQDIHPEDVLSVLGKRLARYGLTLHPDKTRFVDFRNNRPNGTDHPETDGTSFTFLGFAHVWGKSRLGKNVVRQVTAKNRYARALAGSAHGPYRLDHRSFLYCLRAAGARRLFGASSVVYEGLPTHPDAGRPWRIAEELDVKDLSTPPRPRYGRFWWCAGPDEPTKYHHRF